MFNAHNERMFERAQQGEGTRVPLHNYEATGEQSDRPEGTLSSSLGSAPNKDGTWGERDIGGPVNFREAMMNYEEMRRELTSLSKTRSQGAKSTKSAAEPPSGMKKVTTRGTNRSHANDAAPDLEAQESEKPEEEEARGGEDASEDDEDDFELGEFLKDGHFEKRQEGRSAKRVGVVYKNLTVQGVGATATFVKTLPNAVVGVRYPELEFREMQTNLVFRLLAPICTSS